MEYELVVIISSQADKKDREKLTNLIKKKITSLKGKVTKVDDWGVRDFTYPIKKQTKADYVQFNFSLEKGKLAVFKKELQSKEKILRHLLIKAD